MSNYTNGQTPEGVIHKAMLLNGTDKFRDDGKSERFIKMLFNTNDAGVAEFKATMEQLNPLKVVTNKHPLSPASELSDDEFYVSFKSTLSVAVADSQGNTLTEGDIPQFINGTKGDSGKAVVEYTVVPGKNAQGKEISKIYLNCAIITELDVKPTTTQNYSSERRSALLESVRKANSNS